jgi:hypothetical protein
VRKIINYQVIKKNSLTDLFETMKAGFKDNWQTLGGITVIETGKGNIPYEYFQAVVQ